MLAIISAFGMVMAVVAQDESPAENACYAGGEMEGKCDWPTEEETEWAWNCGWYYAAVQSAEVSLSQIPETCSILFGSVDLGCIAVNDVFENEPGEPEFTVLPPGVLDNDTCTEVVSYSLPVVIEGGAIVSFTLYTDGGFDYEVMEPGTVFTFAYTTESGSVANVTVYHDMDYIDTRSLYK